MAFKAEVLKIAEDVGQRMEDLHREVLFQLGSNIVMRTPVGDPDRWKSLNPSTNLATKKIERKKAPEGYVGGRARGSWQYNFGTPGNQDIETIDKTGDVSKARIENAIKPTPGLHFISSNLVYMDKLESGHSDQAPHGMVQLAVIDFDGTVDAAVHRVKKVKS